MLGHVLDPNLELPAHSRESGSGSANTSARHSRYWRTAAAGSDVPITERDACLEDACRLLEPRLSHEPHRVTTGRRRSLGERRQLSVDEQSNLCASDARAGLGDLAGKPYLTFLVIRLASEADRPGADDGTRLHRSRDVRRGEARRVRRGDRLPDTHPGRD